MLLRGTSACRASRAIPLLILCVVVSSAAGAADLDDAWRLYHTGQYDACIRAASASAAVAKNPRDESWPILLARAQMERGLYLEAESTLTNALVRNRFGLRTRLAGHEALTAAGQTERASALIQEINQLGAARLSTYRDPINLIALGQAALLLGADPKLVLDNFYDRARKADPDLLEGYQAAGDLALDKHDYALAARTFSEGLKRFPENADLHYGLARAYEPSSSRIMVAEIEAALHSNSNHVPTLLLLAERQLDAEDYEGAHGTLDRALAVNPWRPEAWALKAAMAHLANDPSREEEARGKALNFWKTNPLVDHLIGRKLSQNYRFAEGSAYQRRALEFNADYLPAKIQLAQDALRLGHEEEGWALADTVHRQDGYDVNAYNLVTLKETLSKFRTLTNEHFILRMSEREASVYGDRAMELLEKARARLTEKYGLTLDRPTTVEIFPEQKDFAVRTFGMPHNPGFLGVCFGHVVTANSPASRGGNPSNWEAVLWHEYCHVVTLQMTRNKMPRWLSEGISVYEELQENPAWGQSMNPRYRDMILGGELSPVGSLSGAFLAPKTDFHMEFAYFQSSLVVAYLIEKHGFESLQAILKDLGEGVPINEAIARHTAPIEEIETGFAEYARAKAEALAPGLDWTRPEPEVAAAAPAPVNEFVTRPEDADDPSEAAERRRPASVVVPPDAGMTNRHGLEPSTNDVAAAGDAPAVRKPNFWRLERDAARLMKQEKWEEARAVLTTLSELYPQQTGPGSAHANLGLVYRALGDVDREQAALSALAGHDPAAPDVYLRLMEIGAAGQNWSLVELNANRYLAVNPLVPQPYRYLGRAAEALDKRPVAVQSYERLLMLDPPDPADAHFRLARLLKDEGDPAARRHLLQALEEAPRFRDALKLLLAMTPAETPQSSDRPKEDNRR